MRTISETTFLLSSPYIFHAPFDYLFRNRQQMKLLYLRKLIYQVTTAEDINVPTKASTLFWNGQITNFMRIDIIIISGVHHANTIKGDFTTNFSSKNLYEWFDATFVIYTIRQNPKNSCFCWFREITHYLSYIKI